MTGATTADQVGKGLLFDAVILVLMTLWWAPTMAAIWRKHPRVPVIVTLTLFLAWPVALVMVVAEPSHRPKRLRPVPEQANVRDLRSRTWQ